MGCEWIMLARYSFWRGHPFILVICGSDNLILGRVALTMCETKSKFVWHDSRIKHALNLVPNLFQY